MSLQELYQTADFRNARRFLFVVMTQEEDKLFDDIMDLLAELPTDPEMICPISVYERLILLTADAQKALQQHPDYTPANLMHLGRVILSYLRSHPNMPKTDTDAALKYLDSIVYVSDFIVHELERARQVKHDTVVYPLQVTADCMFHLRELLFV